MKKLRIFELIFILNLQLFKITDSKFNDDTMCEIDLDSTRTNLQRWAPKSKYVIPMNWYTSFPGIADYDSARMICEDEDLELPSAYHLQDWLSLQNIARSFTAEEVAKKNSWWDNVRLKTFYGFLTGNIYDTTTTTWVVEKTMSKPFIIWDTFDTDNAFSFQGEPNAFTPKDSNSIRIHPHPYPVPVGVTNPTAYIAEGDDDFIARLDRKIVCQFPEKKACFMKSQEETDNDRIIRDLNYKEIQYLGAVGVNEYWIGVQPVYFAEAVTNCESKTISAKKGKLFDGVKVRLTADEMKSLKTLTDSFLMDILGIIPYGSFVGADSTSRWTWDGMVITVQPISQAANLYLCYWSKSYTNRLKCEDDLPKLDPELLRWKGNSKYVYIKDWNYYDPIKNKNADLQDQKAACLKAGLLLPSTYHRQDWNSFQEITRNWVSVKSIKVGFKDLSQRKFPFFTGNTFSERLKRWLPVQPRHNSAYKAIDSDWVPFIVWDNSRDNPNKDGLEWINNIRVINITNIYITEGDGTITTALNGEGMLVCMYPTYSPCFTESAEEKASPSSSVDRVTEIGITKDFKWWISTEPEYYEEALDECSKVVDLGESAKFFDSTITTLDKSNLEKLYELIMNHLTTQDLYPFLTFHQSPNGEEYRRWRWNDFAKTSISIENLPDVRKSVNFYLCFTELKFKKSCTKDLSPDLHQWTNSKGNSKYVYGKATIPAMTYDQQKIACSAVGLDLPSAYHIQDWTSLQELAVNNPDGTQATFFTGNTYDDKLELWLPVKPHPLENDGTKKDLYKHAPYLIWDPRVIEPSLTRPTTFKNVIRIVPYKDNLTIESYISEGSQDPAIPLKEEGRIVCQYPTYSDCFLKSAEEVEYEGKPKYYEMLSMDKFDLWIFLRPEYFLKAMDECANLGRVRRIFNGRFISLSMPMDKLHGITTKYLTDAKILPSAAFISSGPSKNPFATPKKDNTRWKWDDPLTNLVSVEAIHNAPNLYVCYYKKFQFGTRCESDLHPGFKKLAPNSKFVYHTNLTPSMTREAQMHICNDEGLTLPSAYHVHDWKALQDLARFYITNFAVGNDWKDFNKEANKPFFTGNYFNETSPGIGRWMPVEPHPNDTFLQREAPYIIWDSSFPDSPPKTDISMIKTYVNNIRFYEHDGKPYISEGNAKEVSPGVIEKGAGMVVCQFRPCVPILEKCPCFTESKEELKYNFDPWKDDDFRYMGQTQSYLWWIGVRPVSYATAERDCDNLAQGGMTAGFFNGEEITNTLSPSPPMSAISTVEYIKIESFTAGFLKNLDLHPRPPFLGRAGAEQWIWNSVKGAKIPAPPASLMPETSAVHKSYWHKYLCATYHPGTCK